MGLFRDQVMMEQRVKLVGDVIIPTSIHYKNITILFFVLLLIFVFTALFGKFTRGEVAYGQLTSSAGIIRLSATQSGVVRGLYYEEGAHVKEGDPLVSIEDERQNRYGKFIAHEDMDAKRVRVSSLKDALSLKLSELDNQAEYYAAKFNQIYYQLHTAEEKLVIQKELVSSLSYSLSKYDNLLEEKYISRQDYEKRKQEYLNAQIYLLEIEDLVEYHKEQMKVLSAEKLSATNKINEEKNELIASIRDAESELSSLEYKAEFIVRAPVSGTVSSITVSEGYNVDTGTPILTILPKEAHLMVDLFLPSRSIGFVKEGQNVDLAYDAFPHQRYGKYSGTVISVAKTVLLPNDVAAYLGSTVSEPVYRVRVDIDKDLISYKDTEIPLQVGMSLTANIVYSQDSLFERAYLFVKSMVSRA